MKVITINREYGAGGHTIGRKVAERLGIEFYDRDIIRAASKTSGIDIEEIEKEEEALSKTDSFLRAITPAAYDTKDSVFMYESKAIIALAKQAPCVILGRCANALLEDAGLEPLTVMLQGTPDQRVPRAGELLGIEDPDQIKHQMHKIDLARHAYYEYYTRRNWERLSDYDLALNSLTLGTDACVDIICRAAQADEAGEAAAQAATRKDSED